MSNTVLTDDQSEFSLIEPGAWTPDVPPPFNSGIVDAVNIVPRANGLYGPARAPLTEQIQNDAAVFGPNRLKVHGDFHSGPLQQGQAVRFYAGTLGTGSGGSRIVSQEENGAWSNLSKSGNYTTSPFEPWRFANFGLNVIAGCQGEQLQLSQGGAALFDTIVDSPRASDLSEVRGFLVVVQPNDQAFGEGFQPLRVSWSAIGDAANWPDPTSDEAINVLSGFQDLFGGGPLRAVVSGIGGSDAIILSGRKMWRMNFVGPPTVWQFDEIETDQGTEVAGAVAPFNETLFMLGQNGFYHFDGQNSRPIGHGQMDDFFLNEVSFSSAFGFQSQCVSAVDRYNKNYCVAYRSEDAPGNGNNRMLRFNWLTGNWSVSNYAIDAMGSLSNKNSSIDAPLLHVIGQDYETQTLTGSTLEAIIEAREVFRQDGLRSRIKSVTPLIDSSAVEARIRTRERLDKALIDTQNRTWSPNGTIRFEPKTVVGRYYRCRMRIPAGEEWSYYQGLLYESSPWSVGAVRDA